MFSLNLITYAGRQLGVQLETTGISQAKGAVEHANQTFQYRLVNELRLQTISSIKQADQFLIASFVPKYNWIFPARLVGFRKGTDCLVIKALDGQLFASVDDRVCALHEIPKHAVSSPEFDVPVPSVPKKRYIPPMSHPWKRSYFLRIQQQTHRQFRISWLFYAFFLPS